MYTIYVRINVYTRWMDRRMGWNEMELNRETNTNQSSFISFMTHTRKIAVQSVQ